MWQSVPDRPRAPARAHLAAPPRHHARAAEHPCPGGYQAVWAVAASVALLPSRYTSPLVPSTVMVWPVWMAVVPVSVPTTAGTPNSRATIAVWQSRPPVAVTMAPATENTGTQGGSVISHTMTSPSSRLVASLSDRTTRAVPVEA